MKKIILLLLVLFGTYESFSQGYEQIFVSYSNMPENCQKKMKVCFERCWSTTLNCNDTVSIICNESCVSFNYNDPGTYLGSLSGLTVCSNKISIFMDCGTFIFDIQTDFPNVGAIKYFKCSECCFKLSFIGYIGPNNTPEFYITDGGSNCN